MKDSLKNEGLDFVWAFGYSSLNSVFPNCNNSSLNTPLKNDEYVPPVHKSTSVLFIVYRGD